MTNRSNPDHMENKPNTVPSLNEYDQATIEGWLQQVKIRSDINYSVKCPIDETHIVQVSRLEAHVADCRRV